MLHEICGVVDVAHVLMCIPRFTHVEHLMWVVAWRSVLSMNGYGTIYLLDTWRVHLLSVMLRILSLEWLGSLAHVDLCLLTFGTQFEEIELAGRKILLEIVMSG
jgi:hypothetical protein